MITIRPFEQKDIDALIGLGKVFSQESRYQNQTFDPIKIRSQMEAYFQDDRGKYICIVGFKDDVAMGFLFGSIDEYWFAKERGANMIIWYVAQEARGTAMGVKLLLAFKRWAENREAMELTVSITSGLGTERTGQFLRKVGFKHCGENYYQRLGQVA
jgi:GNAT superfamily N-acetyltransferase